MRATADTGTPFSEAEGAVAVEVVYKHPEMLQVLTACCVDGGNGWETICRKREFFFDILREPVESGDKSGGHMSIKATGRSQEADEP